MPRATLTDRFIAHAKLDAAEVLSLIASIVAALLLSRLQTEGRSLSLAWHAVGPSPLT
jgi:hypothetical protein